MAYEHKRAAFKTPDNTTRPIYYFTFPSPKEADLKTPICREVEACLTAGCGGLIPMLPTGTELKDAADVDAVREMYRILLQEAATKGLTVAFFLDSADAFCYPNGTINGKEHTPWSFGIFTMKTARRRRVS